MAEVSIIVPVYQVDKYLKECVNSILAQTFIDFELLLVNDGSFDQCASICDGFLVSDKRLYVINKINGGVSSARNVGIEQACGKYIVFVDSDDYLSKDYLEKLIQLANENKNAGQLCCGFQSVLKGKIVYKRVASQEQRVTVFDKSHYFDYCNSLLAQSPVNKIYERKVINSNCLYFDETMVIGEDWLFNIDYLNCQKSEKIIVLNQPLYNYRYVESSASNKYQQKYLENHLKLSIVLEKTLKEWKTSYDQWQQYYNYLYYIYEMALFNTISEDNPIDLKKKMKINNEILSSKQFRKALKEANIRLHPIFRVAYSLKKFEVIYLMSKIKTLKKKRGK